MSTPGAERKEPERGQASIEFLGVLPAVLLVALVAWQVVLAGHASWLTAQAARVGARAHVVGEDPEAAARTALPRHLRRGLSVTSGPDGRVTVRARLPLLLRRWSAPVRVAATAGLPPP
jgi:pilus assembly protein CpaE